MDRLGKAFEKPSFMIEFRILHTWLVRRRLRLLRRRVLYGDQVVLVPVPVDPDPPLVGDEGRAAVAGAELAEGGVATHLLDGQVVVPGEEQAPELVAAEVDVAAHLEEAQAWIEILRITNCSNRIKQDNLHFLTKLSAT